MAVWKTVRHYVLPTRENVYRPHLLSKSWLVFFLALSLGIEGFLVTGLVTNSSAQGMFITQAALEQQVAAAGAAQPTGSLMQNFARQFLKTFSNADMANAILGTLGVLVLLLALLAFLHHIDVQSREMLMAAFAVSFVALLCVAANVHFLSPNALPAAVVESRG